MLNTQSFYVYNYMEGKTLMHDKFSKLDKCIDVLKNKEKLIPKESYFAIGVNYISNEGIEQSKDFIQYKEGNVELIEVIDGTHITEIPEFCEALKICIAKYKA